MSTSGKSYGGEARYLDHSKMMNEVRDEHREKGERNRIKWNRSGSIGKLGKREKLTEQRYQQQVRLIETHST